MNKLARVAASDFTILLRPVSRFSLAGFPTKLAESMACGVPIIGNLTSNIGDYVHKGVEGVLVANETPEAFAEGLLRARALRTEAR